MTEPTRTHKADEPEEKKPTRSLRVNWQVKAIWPVAVVLLNGMFLFLLATLSLQNTERNRVLLIAGAGAVAICGVVIVALAYVIQRPVVELQEQIERVGEGDLNASVSFAKRNDEIGDLGRNFNRMVQQLRESREEIDLLHRTQMSRAEHFATLGEMATGLAHEIRNPLAGIAGVIEIIARDLPASSPARAVVKDVREEIAQINRILTDLLSTARPRASEMRPSDLNTTTEHAVMLARQQVLSKPIKIEFTPASGLPEVWHDSDQIHQVLLNLLLNAVQAIKERVWCRSGCLLTMKMRSSPYRTQARESPLNISRIFFAPSSRRKEMGRALGSRLCGASLRNTTGELKSRAVRPTERRSPSRCRCISGWLPLRKSPPKPREQLEIVSGPTRSRIAGR